MNRGRAVVGREGSHSGVSHVHWAVHFKASYQNHFLSLDLSQPYRWRWFKENYRQSGALWRGKIFSFASPKAPAQHTAWFFLVCLHAIVGGGEDRTGLDCKRAYVIIF